MHRYERNYSLLRKIDEAGGALFFAASYVE